MQSIDEIQSNFAFLEDWEDKYRYLIELGEALAPLPAEYKTDTYKVDGCMSQVWLYPKRDSNGKYTFLADSDALIVKGLIAVILCAYNDKTADEIRSVPIEKIFETLGLETHLSPTRRDGFFAMVRKIQSLA